MVSLARCLVPGKRSGLNRDMRTREPADHVVPGTVLAGKVREGGEAEARRAIVWGLYRNLQSISHFAVFWNGREWVKDGRQS